jgi:mRNA-degrading endonuclease toxin of MazEF toxin-antitoxin module
VVLLSRDEAYRVRDLIIITPVTTRIRSLPTEVRIDPEDGLPRPSVANLDTINMIPKASLRQRIAILTPEKLRAVEAALHFALGLEE